jgi:hypothetical protein
MRGISREDAYAEQLNVSLLAGRRSIVATHTQEEEEEEEEEEVFMLFVSRGKVWNVCTETPCDGRVISIMDYPLESRGVALVRTLRTEL